MLRIKEHDIADERFSVMNDFESILCNAVAQTWNQITNLFTRKI